MRRRLPAVALALGLGVLLALGFFPQAPLKTLAEARLSAAAGGRATIARLHVVPWRLRAEAAGVRLESPTLSLQIDTLSVEALPAALRGPSLALRSVAVEGLDVRLTPGRAAPAPGAAPTPSVRIESLTLRGGRVRYSDPALGGDVLLSGLAASGAVGPGVLDVRAAEIRIEGPQAPPPLAAHARIATAADLRSTLDEAVFASARSTLRATGALGMPASPSPELDFDAALDAHDLASLGGPAAAEGVLRVSGHVSVATRTWEAKLHASRLAAAGLTLERVEGSATGRPAGVSGRLGFDALGGRVAAEARVADGAHDLRVDASGIRAEAVAALAGSDAVLRGAASASLRLRGPRSRLQASLVLHGPELSLDGTPLAVQAEAHGSLAPDSRDVRLTWSARADARPDHALGSARVVGAHLEATGTAEGWAAPEVTARGAGRVALAGGHELPFEANYRGRGLEIASATLHVPDTALAGLLAGAAGWVGLDAEIHGTPARLGGSVRLAARDVAWRGVDVGAVHLEAEGRDGAWTLAGEMPGHALRLDARSPRPGRGEREVSGTLTLADSALAALAPLLPAPAPTDGRVTGRVEFEGPLAEPSAVVWRTDLGLAGRGYEARAAGGWGAAARAALDLQLTARADAAALELVEGLDLAGQVTADVRLGGTIAEPAANGTVRLEGGRLAGAGFPEVAVAEAVVALDGPGAELRPTVFVLADGSVTASGRATLDGRDPARFHLEWSGLLAEKLLRAMAPERAESLTGRLSGRADVTGRGRDLSAWDGDATLLAEGVRVADLTIALTPLSLRLERGVLVAAPVTVRSGPGALDLEGRFDLVRRTLAAHGKGALDLRALSPLVGAASVTGQAELDVSVAGAFDAPTPRGSLVVREAAVRVRDIPEALTGIEARLVFDGDGVRLESASAVLGGGTLTASGGGRLAGGSLADLRIDVRGRDMALRYPAGLRSRLEADLVLSQTADAFLLRGDVRALRGLYDLDVAIEQSVRAPVVEPAPSPFLRSIGLDVRVVLESPVLVRNKLASLDVEGGLQFRGDLEAPAAFGRLEIARGGKIFLSGREFAVETGRLSYAGDWDPEVALRATRRIRDEADLVDHDVELIANGRLATVQPVLRAEGLSDGQTLSLVATGRSTGAAGKEIGANVAGQQAANLLLGSVSQSLGFDEVPVQPELLARETDPGTRFTFGKQLTPILSLIYSLSLKGPEQRFIQVEARLPYSISVKGQRTDDGLLAAAVGQVLRFGGAKRPKPGDERVRLTQVRVEGDVPAEARSALSLEAGDRVAAWDVQESADRLRRRLNQMGYVEAQVGGRLVEGRAELRVQAGPRFDWTIVGMEAPPDLSDALREALYEEDAIERCRGRLLEALRRRGHLRGRIVAVRSLASPGRRTLAFTVEPGPVLEAEVEFPGAERLGHGELLSAAGGPAAFLVEPELAAQRIVGAYAAAHRFGARVGTPAIEQEGNLIGIRVEVDEGPAPRIAAVEFDPPSLPAAELLRISGLAVGALYSPTAAAAAVERIRDDYYARGHAQAGVVAETVLRGADVAVRFRVRVGERLVVGAVEIVGLRRTRESVVRRQVRLKPGDPVDPRELARTERRLLDLGPFAQVQVSANGSPATLRIELVERERVETAYDLRWSEESGLAAQGDVEVRNLAGLGLNLGGRYRLGADDREARLSLVLPTLRRGKLTLAAFEIQEDFEATDIFTGEPFTNTQTERVVEVQQALRVKRHTSMLAGYRFKTVFSTAFPTPIHIASLDLSGIRETRDNPLDARRGHLASLNVQLSPRALGSEITFVKGFGQLFLHRPLGAWTWSQGLQLGVAHGFDGQLVIPSERFFAGGAHSLRGYALDSVGPVDVLGEPAGGDAVLVVTEELRYRHRSGLGFALFWDAGNVFEKAKDLSLDLRHDLGGGLRWTSPVGLLRLDLGFPLARREGEDSYQLYFSLGQVF